MGKRNGLNTSLGMNRCHKLIFFSDFFIYWFLTVEETETQKLNDLSEVIELESGKIKILHSKERGLNGGTEHRSTEH